MSDVVKYTSEKGTAYELRGDEVYREGQQITNAFFFSEESFEMQEDMIKGKEPNSVRDLLTSDSCDTGYVVQIAIKDGKIVIRGRTSKLTRVIEESIDIKEESSED